MMNGLLRWRPSKRSVVESAADAPCGSGPAILCRGLTKEFGRGETRVLALRGADFMALPGSITMLVGPSGCGKTTLASIVAGLLNPTGGELHVLGEDIRQLSPAALIAFRARHIGFVFQQYNLLPALTAAQNACLPLLVAGRRRSEAIERAREMLDRVGLGGKSEAYSSQLSGGQQQRVAIARALVHEPRLLICDEPTAALDAQSGQTVMELFCQVAVRPGRAVLIVTHDNRILHYAQRTVHMSDGRIQRVEIENTAEPPATAAASAPSPFMVELSS